MRRWAVRILIAVVTALLAVPSSAASTSTALTVAAYTYDSHHHAASPYDTTTERGPPATYDRSGYHAVDDRSGGASARPEGPRPGPAAMYNTRAQLAQAAGATATTWDQAQGLGGAPSSVPSSGVAAKTVDDILPTPQVSSQGLQNHIDALYKQPEPRRQWDDEGCDPERACDGRPDGWPYALDQGAGEA